MRPRPFGRGNIRAFMDLPYGDGRFNEATAFRPWKSQQGLKDAIDEQGLQ